MTNLSLMSLVVYGMWISTSGYECFGESELIIIIILLACRQVLFVRIIRGGALTLPLSCLLNGDLSGKQEKFSGQ